MNETIKLPILYTYIEEIGKGAFGKVLKVEDLWGDEVAIKILNEDSINDISIKRFDREMKIHKMLEHKNIVPILDFNSEEEVPYYVMPLAKRNLSEELAAYREDNLGYMKEDDIAYYFAQILDAIEYAHSEGVIHRDLKPLNILVYGESTLKVADFGLGKFISRDTESLTMTTMGIGSECYAAPEQYQEGEAKNVDERADIYSLGKILYQLITYDLPVVIDEEKIKNSKFKLLVMKATKYDKNKRFNSVSEMKKMFNLLRGDKKKLKSTNQAFKEIYTEYINELDAGKIYELVEILLENEKNYALYTTEFMTIDINTLKIIKEEYPVEFELIIKNYIKHTDTMHIFSFTDAIYNFLINVVDILDNLELYEDILSMLIRLAYNHNRYYIGQKLAQYIVNLDNNRLNELIIVCEILQENENYAKWLKNYLLHYELPYIVQEAI